MPLARVESLAIADVKLLTPARFDDARGFFSEVWQQGAWAEHGVAAEFVQDNHALSLEPGVLRGLHYQIAPAAQGKLVRVAAGAIFDVAVDIRRESDTFGRYVSAVVSADTWNQLWVPVGFAHGYCVLEPNTVVLYKTTTPYAPEHERGVRYDDPALAIAWPVSPREAIISDRDRTLPLLAGQTDLF